MSDDLATLNQRVGKAADDLLAAIYAFEHALADCHTPEAATLVANTLGHCYSAMDRVNIAAVQRKAHLEVMRDLKA